MSTSVKRARSYAPSTPSPRHLRARSFLWARVTWARAGGPWAFGGRANAKADVRALTWPWYLSSRSRPTGSGPRGSARLRRGLPVRPVAGSDARPDTQWTSSPHVVEVEGEVLELAFEVGLHRERRW